MQFFPFHFNKVIQLWLQFPCNRIILQLILGISFSIFKEILYHTYGNYNEQREIDQGLPIRDWENRYHLKNAYDNEVNIC